MKSPKEMEKSLHALMPAALSECCHQRISQKIRALALADVANLGAESATQQSLAAVTLPPVSQALVSRMPWHTALSSQQEISAPQKKIANPLACCRRHRDRLGSRICLHAVSCYTRDGKNSVRSEFGRSFCG